MNFISKSLKKYSKTSIFIQKKCVFEKFNKLAELTHSINLAAGTPSTNPPSIITDAFAKYSNQKIYKSNQFSPQNYALNKKISFIYQPNYLYKLIPTENIIVTTGADKALTSSLNVLLDQGDQAITFDPSYQGYRMAIQSVGARAIGIPLKPTFIQSKQEIKLKGPDYISNQKDRWDIDFKMFSQSLNDRTRILLINSPHNPTGKIFTEEELKQICRILQKFPRVIVIDDRVYQHSHYDRYLNKQVPKISNLNELKNRTISIYSGGKLLRVNDLKCGWLIGPEKLINKIKLIDQPPELSSQLHLAVSETLSTIYNQNNYLKNMTQKMIKLRNHLLNSLIESKYDFNLWIPQGGYFVLADIGKIQIPKKYYYDSDSGESLTKDYAFSTKLCKEDGVSSIPCSSFYDKQNCSIGQNLIRFAFCKDQISILQAGKRMKQIKNQS